MHIFFLGPIFLAYSGKKLEKTTLKKKKKKVKLLSSISLHSLAHQMVEIPSSNIKYNNIHKL